MSDTKLRVVADYDQPTAETETPETFTEELPPLTVDVTSFDARVAGIESCSVAREIAKHRSTTVAYYVEQAQSRGGELTHEEAWEIAREKRPDDLDEFVQVIRRKSAHYIDWGELGRAWNAAPSLAMEIWKAIRQEAQEEFFSGHYGARAFESADYMREAFKRAQYLAVRDGLIEEWTPRGASEFILIDQMTQAYVMQVHWTEVAMRQSQTKPRMESNEFTHWKQQRGIEDKVHQWDDGYWDIPYQHKAEAVEQAFRLVDLCQKAFQRAARQLANIRLVRAKTARARRRDRVKTLKPINKVA